MPKSLTKFNTYVNQHFISNQQKFIPSKYQNFPEAPKKILSFHGH